MLKRLFTMVGVFMLVIAASCPALAEKPELQCTVPSFIEGYNENASKMNLSKVSFTDMESTAEDITQIPLTKFSMVVLTTNHGRTPLTEAGFFGVGNGTPESGAIIMSSALAYLYAILPFGDKDAINDLFTQILKTVAAEKKFLMEVGGVKISTRVDPNLGFMIFVTPSVQ